MLWYNLPDLSQPILGASDHLRLHSDTDLPGPHPAPGAHGAETKTQRGRRDRQRGTFEHQIWKRFHTWRTGEDPSAGSLATHVCLQHHLQNTVWAGLHCGTVLIVWIRAQATVHLQQMALSQHCQLLHLTTYRKDHLHYIYVDCGLCFSVSQPGGDVPPGFHQMPSRSPIQAFSFCLRHWI